MNIQLMHIQQLDTKVSAVLERPVESKEDEYKGLAIEKDGNAADNYPSKKRAQQELRAS
jgi:hypothetical protein